MKKTTAQRLNELMDYFNITQQDICDKTGIPKSSMSMYVSGKRSMRQDKITLICKAYKIDEAWFMGYDVPMSKELSDKSADEDFEFIKRFSRLKEEDKKTVIDLMDSLILRKGD